MRQPLAALALMALAACVPATGGPDPTGGTLEDDCGAASLQYLVGEDVSQVFAMTFTQPVRIIRPGDVVTMDFSAQRLNFRLDENETVVSVDCG